ncbi:MAG: hypothetical protein H5T63_00870 [Chloroflexi bacterium]|nr:hypothetical protein [Chloroflexota bacterium]
MLFLLVTMVAQPVLGYMADHLLLLPSFTVGWAAVKIALLAVGLLFGVTSLLAKLGRRLSLAGSLLLVWVLLVQAIQAPGLLATFPEETQIVLGNTLLTSAGLWLIGSNLEPLFNLLVRSRAWKSILWLLYGGFAFAIVWGTAVGFAQSGHFIGLYRDPRVRLEYLQISDAFALLTFFVAAVAERKAMRVVVLLLGGVLLFATLSRASFLFYWLVVGLRALLAPGRRRPLQAALLLAAAVTAVVVVLTVNVPPDAWGPYRMVEFLRTPLADESVHARLGLLAEGLPRFSGHWLLGSFMAEVTQGAGMGTYIHNWLSFWEAYGLGPFLLSSALIAAIVYGALRVFGRHEVSKVQLCAAYIGMFCFFQVAMARSYVWPYIWLAIGASSTLWRRRVWPQRGQSGGSTPDSQAGPSTEVVV